MLFFRCYTICHDLTVFGTDPQLNFGCKTWIRAKCGSKPYVQKKVKKKSRLNLRKLFSKIRFFLQTGCMIICSKYFNVKKICNLRI